MGQQKKKKGIYIYIYTLLFFRSIDKGLCWNVIFIINVLFQYLLSIWEVVKEMKWLIHKSEFRATGNWLVIIWTLSQASTRVYNLLSTEKKATLEPQNEKRMAAFSDNIIIIYWINSVKVFKSWQCLDSFARSTWPSRTQLHFFSTLWAGQIIKWTGHRKK